MSIQREVLVGFLGLGLLCGFAGDPGIRALRLDEPPVELAGMGHVFCYESRCLGHLAVRPTGSHFLRRLFYTGVAKGVTGPRCGQG